MHERKPFLLRKNVNKWKSLLPESIMLFKKTIPNERQMGVHKYVKADEQE